MKTVQVHLTIRTPLGGTILSNYEAHCQSTSKFISVSTFWERNLDGIIIVFQFLSAEGNLQNVEFVKIREQQDKTLL